MRWRHFLVGAVLLGSLWAVPSRLMSQAAQPAPVVPNFADFGQARQWLEANRLHPAYVQMAERAVGLAPSLDAAITLLDELARSAPDLTARSRLWFRAGVLAERGNRFEQALSLFERSIAGDPTIFEARLGVVRAALELGQTQRALTMATDVINGAPTLVLQRQAAVVRARALWFAGRTETALRHLGAMNAADDPAILSPNALLLEFEVARSAGDNVRQQRVLGQLTRHFPAAPETLVARGQALFSPSPAQLLPPIGVAVTTTRPAESAPTPLPSTRPSPPTSAASAAPAASTMPTTPAVPTSPPASAAAPAVAQRQPIGLQTGSFRDSENAAYMVEDLRRLGFAARIAEVTVADGSVFFRVLVPISATEDVQRLVAQLKEQGIEGLLLF